jgi:hypothetical protein
VRVDENLFSAGFPSRIVPSGRDLKLRYRGSSGSRCFCRLLGSMVVNCYVVEYEIETDEVEKKYEQKYRQRR